MSQINPPWDYHQPDFYRFSQDSIAVATKAAVILATDSLKAERSDLRILDACCGCGVIGFEFLGKVSTNYHQHSIYLISADINEKYRKYYWQNLSLMIDQSYGLKKMSFEFRQADLTQFQTEEGKFDLIMLNPPYYQGTASSNKYRAVARNMSVESMELLLNSLLRCLTPDGYLIMSFNSRELLIDLLKKCKYQLSYECEQIGDSNIFIFIIRHLQKK